jgi:hypothetical protein
MSRIQNFIGEPLRHRRFDLAWYRISQLMHDRTNGGFDSIYMQLARLLWPKVDLPNSAQMSEEQLADVDTHLQRDGYMILPLRLSADQIDALRAFAFSTPAHGVDMSKEIMISPDNLPDGEARYSWWMHDLARLPVIQRLIGDGPYCAIAQNYLGCRPTLAHISLWIDVPFVGKYDAYIYHYDNEGPGFFKFFFFLSDVADGTGTHLFISGTQAHTKPKRFARAGRYEESELFELYPREREVAMRGPTGTILAEDTSGFHRGSALERDYRLIMQIEFSAIEVPTDQELRRKLVPVVVPGMHPSIASIARKYFASSAG